MNDLRTRERRRKAHAFGLRAETWAGVYLRCKGWRVLTTRYKVPGGEIDIIARRGDVVIFVEVKGRPTLDLASETITAQKQRRISQSVRLWLSRNPWAMNKSLRGDALFIAPRAWPRHIADAFPLDLR
ncbi:MAG TPA: YraN family protein [Beijerinckiaceae bacterium]|nr:YraN family protein [Beijerinckiaceae bacterium]